jgi:hypothetical protein
MGRSSSSDMSSSKGSSFQEFSPFKEETEQEGAKDATAALVVENPLSAAETWPPLQIALSYFFSAGKAEGLVPIGSPFPPGSPHQEPISCRFRDFYLGLHLIG